MNHTHVTPIGAQRRSETQHGTLRVGSLFSGYGGLDLAVANVYPNAQQWWHVEYEPAPSKVLRHHHPGVPNFGDITQIDWATVPSIDILTGGYPCQPFSAAGQRKGTSDERHLWPYVREAIRHLRPRVTFLENVAGHRSLGFDRVLGDLAEDGLHARWTSIRASDIGAPHRRERLFILATPADSHRDGIRQQQVTVARSEHPPVSERDRAEPSPNSQCIESGQRRGADLFRRRARSTEQARVGSVTTPDSSSDSRGKQNGNDQSIEWLQYAEAIERWGYVLGRSAPNPIETGNGFAELAPRFSEWLMGLPDGWVSSVPGVSNSERRTMLGNGVVPQQGARALRDLMKPICEAVPA